MTDFEKDKASVDFYLKKMEKNLAERQRTTLTEKQKIAIQENLDFIKVQRRLAGNFKKHLEQAVGKLPPQALDLEESVLGAILLDTKETTHSKPAIEKVVKFLRPEHFYNEAHTAIFETCLYMREQKLDIDMRTVVFEMRKNGKIELLTDGAYYIASLTSAVSSAANVEYHARCLVEMAIKRDLILFAGSVLHDAYNDTVDCFSLLDTSKEKLNEIEKLHVRK